MSQLYEEALAAQEQGHVEHAEQLFQKVIAQAQNREDVLLQQRCLVQLVAIANERKDTHTQVRWLKKNYNLTKKHNSRQAARLCLDLALVFLKDEDFPASKMWAKKAFDRSMASCKNLLGTLSIFCQVVLTLRFQSRLILTV